MGGNGKPMSLGDSISDFGGSSNVMLEPTSIAKYLKSKKFTTSLFRWCKAHLVLKPVSPSLTSPIQINNAFSSCG